MKLQALISWQSPKNQLQQENKKKRDKFWQKRKKKHWTARETGSRQARLVAAISSFSHSPPPTFLSSVQNARETELSQEEAEIRKLHKTQTLKLSHKLFLLEYASLFFPPLGFSP